MGIKHTQPEIIVVSGLPRSGTSLMMQMLQAGGLPLFYDDKRPPDQNNPKGYFELEAVKTLHRDNTWLTQAMGKAVKIISHHLNALPSQFHYKVIFMRRPVHEVILSQNKMLLKTGKPLGALKESELAEHFTAHVQNILQWIEQKFNMDLMQIPYTALLAQPEHWAELIVKFLNKDLNIRAMIRQVDPSLHHVK